jgi:hypothetical protein
MQWRKSTQMGSPQSELFDIWNRARIPAGGDEVNPRNPAAVEAYEGSSWIARLVEMVE